METQLVSAGLHVVTRKQRRIAAAVVVRRDRLDEMERVAFDTEEVDAQAFRRLAEGGVQNVGREPAGSVRRTIGGEHIPLCLS